MKQSALIIFLLLVIAGCNTAHKKEAIKKIDKQLSFIDSTLQQFETLPVDSLREAYRNKLYNQSEQITAIMKENPTTLNVKLIEVAPFLNYVGALYQRFNIANETLIINILNCRNQFETLRSDISEGKIPADSIDIYFETELKYFDELRFKIEIMLEFKTIAEDNREHEIFVDSILSSLNPLQ